MRSRLPGLRSPPARVLLVAMPWARLEHPSIQLGVLKALLDGRGIPSRQAHLYLDFAEHLAAYDRSLDPDAYDDVATRNFIGDWIFSVPPFRTAAADEASYLNFLAEEGEEAAFIAKVAAMRAAVPSFLRRALSQLLEFRPKVVGFTTTFGQTVASLVMAQLLKQHAPDIRIVLGGANCDGPMGEALHRHFPCVDVVVRGEAEPVFADLVASLLRGRTPEPKPGLCLRSDEKSVVVPMQPHAADAAPIDAHLDYDDYFERLGSHRFASAISPRVSIPFESSRGCWWGEKNHCTFCGLNGTAMKFRPMEPQRVLEELIYLANRYQRLEFNAADNIIDRRLFATLIPQLVELRLDLRLFYEVKANLRKSEVAMLAAAGIREIQPGIESLSSASLRRMRKGTTALQNIRVLKWCATYGIKVHWNIIHGLPGDSSAEYEEIAAVAKNCFHLAAPNLIPLSVERFSPYHDDPQAFGIEVLGPKAHYGFIYPMNENALHEVAYAFDHRQLEAVSTESGLASLRAVVEDWQQAEALAGPGTLTLLRGPGFSIIRDRRPGRPPADYRLGSSESELYAACDTGATVASMRAHLGSSAPGEDGVLAFMESLSDAGLVFREGARYLSLATECTASAPARSTLLENVTLSFGAK